MVWENNGPRGLEVSSQSRVSKHCRAADYSTRFGFRISLTNPEALRRCASAKDPFESTDFTPIQQLADVWKPRTGVQIPRRQIGGSIRIQEICLTGRKGESKLTDGTGV